MKRILFLLIALVAVSSVCSAQVNVDSGNTAVEMTLKRCLAQGDQVIMDFVVICRVNANYIYYYEPDVYDDEGNLYHHIPGGQTYHNYIIDGNNKGSSGELVLEKDIPRKMRLITKHVDEYASTFLLIKIPYAVNNGRYTATIKNLPINRE